MSIIDAFFPPVCVSCRHVGSYLCTTCSKSLIHINRDRCLVCNLGTSGLTHPECRQSCPVDRTISIFKYRGSIQKIIKLCKYQLTTQVWEKTKHLLPPSAFYKLSLINRYYLGSVLVPIPLHPARYRERGFNQSVLIAQFYASLLHIPIEEPLLRRKNTHSQANLNEYGMRRDNMKGAFIIAEGSTISQRSFVLVDDVITSGSTMCEAAHALKAQGASQIVALSLARG